MKQAEVIKVKGSKLKDRFDFIDLEVKKIYSEKYAQAMAGVYIGQWYKGREIHTETPRGVSVNYEKLSRDTKRDSDSLKKWHHLYKNYPKLEYFIKDYVMPTTDKIAKRFYDKTGGLSLPPPQQPLLLGFDAPLIWNDSYENWLPEQEDCDLLITDPPYSSDIKDIDFFARNWLPMALGKVKPTGRAYIFIGSYPKEIKAYLNVYVPEHLNIENILIWTYKNTLGPNPQYNYIQNYQSILYYKGVEAPILNTQILMEKLSVHEFIHPARSKERFFEWQKPDELAQMFINHSTQEGDLVIDPFAGSGTFILMANRLKRIGIGCEINKKVIDISLSRGCKLV